MSRRLRQFADILLLRSRAAAAPFVLDTFSGSNGTELSAHTGEIGATWAKHAGFAADMAIQSNRVHHDGGAFSRPTYYASGAPSSANYTVTAVIRVVSNSDSVVGILARIDIGATTWYAAEHDNYHGDAPAKWRLIKFVAGSFTELGTFEQTLSVGQDYTVEFRCDDALKEIWLDGVQRITSADNAITAAGKIGISIYSDVAGDAAEGYHIDSITGQE